MWLVSFPYKNIIHQDKTIKLSKQTLKILQEDKKISNNFGVFNNVAVSLIFIKFITTGSIKFLLMQKSYLREKSCNWSERLD